MRRRVNKHRVRLRVNKVRITPNLPLSAPLLWADNAVRSSVERRAISRAYPSGPRDVDAHVFGPLAVHRNLDDCLSGTTYWIVTHIRTGMAIIGASARATFRQASKIARLLTVPISKGAPEWDFGSFGKVNRDDPRVAFARIALLDAGMKAGLTPRRSDVCLTGYINKKRIAGIGRRS